MSSTPKPDRTPCCKQLYHYETLAGMRLFREVRGRKIYKAKCPLCQRRFERQS